MQPVAPPCEHWRMGECAECHLDVELLDVTEATVLIETEAAGYRLLFALAVDDAQLRASPAPGVWSPLEYAGHVRDATRYHGWLTNRGLTEERPEAPPPDPDAAAADARYNDADPDEVLTGIDQQTARYVARVRALAPDELTRVVVRSGRESTVLDLVRNLAHEVHHHRQDVERQLGSVPA
jgi:hypothetical protein